MSGDELIEMILAAMAIVQRAFTAERPGLPRLDTVNALPLSRRFALSPPQAKSTFISLSPLFISSSHIFRFAPVARRSLYDLSRVIITEDEELDGR